MMMARVLQQGVFLLTFVACLAAPVWAQGADDLTAFRDQVSQLLTQGKSSEAVPIAERYVALARQRYGEDRIEYATSIACRQRSS